MFTNDIPMFFIVHEKKSSLGRGNVAGDPVGGALNSMNVFD